MRRAAVRLQPLRCRRNLGRRSRRPDSRARKFTQSRVGKLPYDGADHARRPPLSRRPVRRGRACAARSVEAGAGGARASSTATAGARRSCRSTRCRICEAGRRRAASSSFPAVGRARGAGRRSPRLGRKSAALPVHGQPVFVVARPDGRQVWVNFALPDNDTVQVIDVADAARSCRRFEPGKAVLHMEFTPRGEQVWISVRDDDRVDDLRHRAASRRLGELPAAEAERHLLHRARQPDRAYDALMPGRAAIRSARPLTACSTIPARLSAGAAALRGDGASGSASARRTCRSTCGGLTERAWSAGSARSCAPHRAGCEHAGRDGSADERLDEVAALVSAYRRGQSQLRARARVQSVVRGHRRGRADRCARCSPTSRTTSGLEVLDLPLDEAFHIDLGFPDDDGHERSQDRRTARALIEDGLPLDGAALSPCSAPAHRLGGESDVIARLRRLIEAGVIRRFGVVVRHRELGYRANAMVVWDVPDDEVDRVGARAGARCPCVTLCYRRPRRLPALALQSVLHDPWPRSRRRSARRSTNLATACRARRRCRTPSCSAGAASSSAARVTPTPSTRATDTTDRASQRRDGARRDRPAIVNALQGGFPLCDRPFAEVGRRASASSEDES